MSGVSALLDRLRPRSLAARMIALLLVALAVGQLVPALALGSRVDRVVEGLGHGQALTQTVTLARLLGEYPPADGDRLAAAFGSRQSCATISPSAPAAAPMSDAEARLAALIAPMLHGVHAGAPRAAIAWRPDAGPPCPGETRFGGGADGTDGGAARTGEGRDHAARGRFVLVSMIVPLADGRWLTTRTAVETPGGFDRATFYSFLASALAVAVVAALAVREQTGPLRALAGAAERLGRGEETPPLSVRGPAEIAAAAGAFNDMQARLRDYLADRLRLLAGIGHDLRTPLTTLRLKAEFIEDEAVRDDLVTTIDELSAICEATLAFARAEATKEETRTVDLAALCADVVGEFAAAGKDARVEPSPSVMLPCRVVALKRALRNLVENALRYGGAARVRVEDRGGSVALVVADDGPGLPEDRIEDAFKPFVRLDESRSVETGGIGLGLAIARSVVKAHGGALELLNRKSRGLDAVIELPKRA
ncbi:MAG: HAMP domain-containing protein [Hyphomicrobiales bacterium]|nr:HAMP domain-containing protein [Hyphomicrobiales bacterium]